MDIGAGQAGAVFLFLKKKRIFKAQKDLKIAANAMHDAAGKKSGTGTPCRQQEPERAVHSLGPKRLGLLASNLHPHIHQPYHSSLYTPLA